MKKASDFQQAAKEMNLTEWPIHNCSMCEYPCGYIFEDNQELVGYDTGCDCTRRYIVKPSNWESVAAHYNMQTNEKIIAKMNEFWGF